MLESNVSVGDTCKEIAFGHDSDDAGRGRRHNAGALSPWIEISSYHRGKSFVDDLTGTDRKAHV